MPAINILLLGPQGSGKGTQAELLANKYGFNYFAAGKILRSIANSNNPNAAMIKTTIDNGGLIPDEFVRLIAWDFINKNDINKGFMFDGYPRSLPQYIQLQEMLKTFGRKIDFVINIEISETETIKRLIKRAEIEHRKDDTPEAIQKRLGIYRVQTHTVFEQAVKEGIGLEINGEQPIEVIHQEIISKLKLQ